MQNLQAAGRVDGVYLDLHGAMVVEGRDGGDAGLLASKLFSDGTALEALYLPGVGFRDLDLYERLNKVAPLTISMSVGITQHSSLASGRRSADRSREAPYSPDAAARQITVFAALVGLVAGAAIGAVTGWLVAPRNWADSATFHNNMNATFNVFWATVRLGIRRIVYASAPLTR